MSNVTYYRDWNDGLVTNQTTYSSGSGTVTNPGTYCKLTPSSTSTDVKTWLDFVPNCVDFDATFSVIFPTGSGPWQQVSLIYRTTYKGSGNDTYAYALLITQIEVSFGHGSNSSSSSWTSLGTTTISQLANDTWHTVRVVVAGTSHSIYVNGTLINTWTDSTYTNAGSVGFRLWAASSTTYLGVDSFTLTAAAAFQAPTASLASGTYVTTKSVSLSSVNSGTIYYTLDGSSPTTASSVYSTPLALSATTTLKAIQSVTSPYVLESVLSDVSAYAYTFISSVPTPVFTTGTGGALILSCAEPSAEILYTLSSVPPTVANAIPYLGTVYSQTTSYTVTAIAYLDGTYSSTSSRYVLVRSIAPNFGPLSLQLSKRYLAASVTNASFVGYLPDGPKVSVLGGGGVMPLGPSFGMRVSDGSILQLTPQKDFGSGLPNNKSITLTYGLPSEPTHYRSDPLSLVKFNTLGSLNFTQVKHSDGPLSLRNQNPKYTYKVSVPPKVHDFDITAKALFSDKYSSTEASYRVFGGRNSAPTCTWILPATSECRIDETLTPTVLLIDPDGDDVAWTIYANGVSIASSTDTVSGNEVSGTYIASSLGTIAFSITMTDTLGSSATVAGPIVSVINDQYPVGIFITKSTQVHTGSKVQITFNISDIDRDTINYSLTNNDSVIVTGTATEEVTIQSKWTATSGSNQFKLTVGDKYGNAPEIIGPVIKVVPRRTISNN